MAEKPRFYDAKISEIKELSTTVKHFVLDYAPEADTNFKAGQFMMVHLKKDGKPHKKPYSIASTPSLDHKIELCIKLVEGGYVSTWFFRLKEGDAAQVECSNKEIVTALREIAEGKVSHTEISEYDSEEF